MLSRKKMENKSPSPYYQPENSITLYKMRLVQHLRLLRMPTPQSQHKHTEGCSRDCHIIERNHTLDTIMHFVNNVEVVDNSVDVKDASG